MSKELPERIPVPSRKIGEFFEFYSYDSQGNVKYKIFSKKLENERNIVLSKVLKTELEKKGFDYREDTQWFEGFEQPGFKSVGIKPVTHYRVRVKDGFVVVSPADCIISRDPEASDIAYTKLYREFLTSMEEILSSI